MTIPKFQFTLRKDIESQKQFLPTRAEPLATGWDVKAAWNIDDLYYPLEDKKHKLYYMCGDPLYNSKSSGIIYRVKETQIKKPKKIGRKHKEIISAFIPNGEYVKIPLGIKILAPEGWWIELKPRSSTFAKKHCQSLYGTIDNGFYNELVFAMQYLPQENLYSHDHFVSLHETGDFADCMQYSISNEKIKNNYLEIGFGESIAQIIPVELKHMEVLEISNEEFDKNTKLQQKRVMAQFGNVRDGGIGSTDKK